jgi:hypothetical protein
MKIFLVFLVLAATGSAQAALVTFNDFPDTPVDTFPNELVATPQGFDFVQTGGDSAHIYTSEGTLRINAQALNPALVVTHSSGNLFNLKSLDMFITEHDFNPAEVFYSEYHLQAFDTNNQLLAELEIAGGAISEWQSLIFDDSWNGIQTLVIDPSSITTGFGAFTGAMNFDNFAANVVPIPAAVWLFGSALAGLGWMRRKQTVSVWSNEPIRHPSKL